MTITTYPPDYGRGDSNKPACVHCGSPPDAPHVGHNYQSPAEAQSADYIDVRAYEIVQELRENPALQDAFFRYLMEENE